MADEKFKTDQQTSSGPFSFKCRVDGPRIIVFPIIDEKAGLVTAQVLELQPDGSLFAHARGYKLEDYRALPKATFTQTDGPTILSGESSKPA